MTSIAFPVVAGTVALVFFLSSLESRWVKGFLSWVPVILFAYIVPAILLKHQVLILAAWLRLRRMPGGENAMGSCFEKFTSFHVSGELVGYGVRAELFAI